MIGQVDALISTGTGSAPNVFRDEWGKGPTVINDQQSLRVGLNTMFDLTGTLAVDVGGAIIPIGTRTAAGTSLSAGLSWRD